MRTYMYAITETVLSCQTAESVYTNRSKCLSVKLLAIPLTVVVCHNIVYTSNPKYLLLRTSSYHDVLLFPRKKRFVQYSHFSRHHTNRTSTLRYVHYNLYLSDMTERWNVYIYLLIWFENNTLSWKELFWLEHDSTKHSIFILTVCYSMFFKYILLINREWGHYREISDRDLDVLTER